MAAIVQSALIGGVPTTDYLFYQSNTGLETLAINYCFRLKYCVSMEVIVRMPKRTDILNHEFQQTFVGVLMFVEYISV